MWRVVVVMRVTTLKATGPRLPALMAYYAGLAEDRHRPGPGRGPVDYYLDPAEPAGRWCGRGRHALGLDGEVTGDQLRAVLDGRHPSTDRPLGRRFGDASARGFDATFSAPKSVSVLWALCPDVWVRAEVLAAHDAAVDAALGFLENYGAVTRRGKDGVVQVDTRGLTVAVFRQHTSRTMDPQLHTHAVIAGKVQDTTGRWLSLDARFLKQQQRTIGWVYDAALRSELTARLGVEWGPVLGGQADISGVPDDVSQEFSQRSAQVDAALAGLIRAWSDDHDGADPEPRTIAGLQRRAVLASRPAKGHGIDATTLHGQWAAQAAGIGFDPDRTLHVLDRPAPWERLTDDQIISEALRRCQDESATWLPADLARHVVTLVGPTDPHATAAVERIDRLAHLAAARCVDLAPEAPRHERTRRDGRPVTEAVTDRRITTRHVLDQETGLQRWAQANVSRHPVDHSDPHRDASRAMAAGRRLVLVGGPAGTGKTTTTARAVESLRSQGRPVVALAPSGKAADVLGREAGCPAETLAAFLTRHRRDPYGSSRWPTGTTVVVDEAGMATTDDLHHLMTLADRHSWRVIAIGDPAQLPAVGRGGMFAHWTDTLPAHHLDQPRRFSEPWEAAASLALRVGDPAAATAYDAHDRLSPVHPALTAARAAGLYHQHASAGHTVAITTTTTDTARSINVEIQRQCRVPGRNDVASADGTRVGVGDRIATRRNQADLRTDTGRPVRNRHTWTVTATRPDGTLTATDPDRGSVTLPADYVARHVELGWAVTGYGTQGDTVDVGIAVLEPGTTRNHTYVALTRGRQLNIAVLPDPTGTTHPIDLLTAIIEPPPRHRSALATAGQLRGEPARPSPTVPPPIPAIEPVERDRVAAMQARLDRLQQRTPSRGLER